MSSELKENYGIGGILECVCVYAKKYIANERVRGKNQLLIIERERNIAKITNGIKRKLRVYMYVCVEYKETFSLILLSYHTI